MSECRGMCLLMAMMITMESPSALIAPTSYVNPICNLTTEMLIAHPTNCAQYYNCRAPGMTFHRYIIEKSLQECPFPQLYNPDTQRCEHYSMVHCGNRFEPLGKCEYAQYACLGSVNCGAPCFINNPTCRYLPDGLNAYEKRPSSPFYTVCVNQRLVYTGQCPDLGTGTPVFDVNVRACRCS